MNTSHRIVIHNCRTALANKDRVLNPAFRLLLISFLCYCIILGTPVQARTVVDLHHSKIANPEEITKSFEQGSEKVKVIVGLALPTGLMEQGNWRSPEFISALRTEIANRQSQVLSRLSAGEFTLKNRYKNFPSFAGEVSIEGLSKLLDDPLVKSVEPSLLEFAQLAQGIPLMNATTPRMIYNGQGIAIAVSDTGVDYTHPRLGGGGFPNSKVIGGYDTGDNDSDPMPNTQAHGTCCAGITGGNLGPVGDYIGGVAYSAKIYALKITYGTGGSAWDSDSIEAWDWCITHQNDDPCNPIMIITQSFGGGQYYSAAQAEAERLSYADAADRVVAAGITLFASSGNEGYCDSLAAPAAFSSVISVGAVYDADIGQYPPPGYVGCISQYSCAGYTEGCPCPGKCYVDGTTLADKVTTYSNTASFLDILAPSNNAYTTDIAGSGGYSTGDYASDFGGTSAACPYAAGAAACLQSAAKANTGSYLSPVEVRTILVSSGDDITDGKVAITKPRVNLTQAISGIESPPIAQDLGIQIQVNTAVMIELQAIDEGLPNPPGDLNYIITSLPSHGTLGDPNGEDIVAVAYTLIGGGNEVLYTPDTDYDGPDSFQYKASDGGTPPGGGDSNIATVSLYIFSVIYSAAMDTNPGWSATGQWQWGLPTGQGGESYGNPDPTSGYTSSNVYGVNLDGDYNTAVVGFYYLITQAINCSGFENVQLKFYRWLNTDYQPYVSAMIQVSNNASSWTTIWQNGSSTDITDSSWQLFDYDISSVADNESTVYVRWGYSVESGAWAYSGWNIDDVLITGETTEIVQRTLTISSTAGGYTEPNEGSHQYSDGTIVDINAIPEPNYRFVNWTGDTNTIADVNAATTTITMDANYTVQANFALDQRSLTVSSTLGGSVTQPGEGTFLYDHETVVDLNAVPTTGYHFVNWTGDTNTIADVNVAITTITMGANYTVIAGFAIDTFTLDYTAGPGGTLTGETSQVVNYGEDGTPVTAVPDTGYHFLNWSDLSTDNPRTDVNVTADINVTANFGCCLSVTATAGPNGVIIPEGEIPVDYGDDICFTAVPDMCYEVNEWFLDGNSVQTGGSYCLNNITESHTMHVTFKPQVFTVTASADANGSIIPSGEIQVNCGASQDFNAVPNLGYEVIEWLLDGNSVQTGGTEFTLSNITADHTVAVSFMILTYTITASADANGLISPSGTFIKDYGSDQLFTATPDIGYEVDTWTVDGNDVQTADDTYNLTDIAADHAIYVTFKKLTFTIDGYVFEIDGNTPVEGVLIQADDNDVNTITDINGYYHLMVDYGWSGIVTPQKEGYFFEPNSYTYTNVMEDYVDINYMATLETFIISGYILEEDLITPITDVNVCAGNGGGQWTSRYGGSCDITDANGYYEVVVDYNWSGPVTPAKYAYAFDVPNTVYENVLEDQNDQNYIGRLLTYTITGYIKNSCEVPIEGILVDANNDGGQDTTDPNGFYEVWVGYNWSGTVTPTKEHYTFDPNWIPYTNVLEDWMGGDYIATNIYDLDCDCSIGFGDLAVMCENWLETGPDVPGDFYKDDDDIVNFLDFAEFADYWQALTEDGLIGYWQFDEGSGDTTEDASGYGNDGTLIGGPAWTSGKF